MKKTNKRLEITKSAGLLSLLFFAFMFLFVGYANLEKICSCRTKCYDKYFTRTY